MQATSYKKQPQGIGSKSAGPEIRYAVLRRAWGGVTREEQATPIIHRGKARVQRLPSEPEGIRPTRTENIVMLGGKTSTTTSVS